MNCYKYSHTWELQNQLMTLLLEPGKCEQLTSESLENRGQHAENFVLFSKGDFMHQYNNKDTST